MYPKWLTAPPMGISLARQGDGRLFNGHGGMHVALAEPICETEFVARNARPSPVPHNSSLNLGQIPITATASLRHMATNSSPLCRIINGNIPNVVHAEAVARTQLAILGHRRARERAWLAHLGVRAWPRRGTAAAIPGSGPCRRFDLVAPKSSRLQVPFGTTQFRRVGRMSRLFMIDGNSRHHISIT
jgi:hypothetical protein